MNATRPALTWGIRKGTRRLARAVRGALYRDTDRNPRNSILVAGTARSGTTWLGDVLSSQLRGRVMFEPFHPGKIEQFRPFNYFQYMRPDEPDEALRSYAERVLTGAIRHPWIDREVDCLFPRCRVIKEVRANLFLKWIRRAFPDTPMLLIVRHPCAVALSRMQLHWATDDDIAPFLSQPKLVADFLGDRMDIVRSATTTAAKHALIWSVHHLVPLQQFEPNELTVVFYEDLCLRPDTEIPRIFRAIGRDFDRTAFRAADRPSATAQPTSAVVAGTDRVSGWTSALSSRQIEQVLAVVDAFGLGHLYGSSPTPLTEGAGPALSAQGRSVTP
jgi:hypothetical protein